MVTTKDVIEPKPKLTVRTGFDQFFQGNVPNAMSIIPYPDQPETITFPSYCDLDSRTFLIEGLEGDLNINMTKTTFSPRQSVRADVRVDVDTSTTPLKGGFTFEVDVSDLMPISLIFPRANSDSSTPLGRTLYYSFVGTLADQVKRMCAIKIKIGVQYKISPLTDEFLVIRIAVDVKGWLADQFFYKSIQPAIVCPCCLEEMDRERCDLESLEAFLSGQCSGSLALSPGSDSLLLTRCNSAGSRSSFDIIDI